jgi:hypothetical protein
MVAKLDPYSVKNLMPFSLKIHSSLLSKDQLKTCWVLKWLWQSSCFYHLKISPDFKWSEFTLS